ncbi:MULTISPECIES: peptidyl-prolyl cis-trans isomerase [Pseudonocardia]|uniref:peptidylprolyl isomerase n=1 Tax=Pseudonocardia abyssalis TaxID=2792008 RepID=A0ABS6V1L6_9PSEU|nr:peptidyl-prolyl cis-trans isomerase [Pseudonocardia abyssalis]MBW0114664.1 peptidyl-prolyl cis-trans isomerase [Pseudonocardia abyssalis]MBW0138287.1 peptidyl-prolyl cis-trans isomerase [Pseudonocardia abyssalis]
MSQQGTEGVDIDDATGVQTADVDAAPESPVAAANGSSGSPDVAGEGGSAPEGGAGAEPVPGDSADGGDPVPDAGDPASDGAEQPAGTESADAGEAEGPESAEDAESAESAGTGPNRRGLRLPTTWAGRAAAAAVVVVVAAAAAGAVWWQASALPADAAYRLDGRTVTVEQLDQRVVALQALYGVQAPEDPAAADGFRRDVAKSVVLSDILDREALERGVVVADKQVTDTRDRYIEEQFGPGGRDAFVRALGNVGTSEESVLDEIRRQMTVGLLMQDVVGTVTVTDEELRAAYADRQDTLGTPERRTLRNIVVESEEQARAAFDEIRGGVAFEQVAADRSRDESTRGTGGLLGDLARDELEAPVGDAAFAVAPGELYGPVQGQFGWNVGRVDAVIPFVPASFDQVADGLRQALQVERSLAIWQDWIAQQVRDADVVYAEHFRPADPDAAPSFGSPAPAEGTQAPR